MACGVSQASAQGAPVAFGVTAGTLGIGAEASVLISGGWVFRVTGSYFGFDLTESASQASNGLSNDYKFDAKATFAGAIVDWHPFSGGFRLSAGARYADLSLNAHEAGGHTINGRDYTATQIGTLHLKVANGQKIMPYLGLGYDAAHFSGKGFNFALGIDVGAMFGGSPDVKLTTDRNVAGLAADIAAEEKDLEGKLKKYTVVYPVLMLTGKVTF